MRHVRLRNSLLEKLRSSGEIYTLNCLECLSAALARLTVHNHVLESILLASRRAIAQYVHLFDHVLTEVSTFVQRETELRESADSHDISLDPVSTRIRFINFSGDIQVYIDAYLASFRSDYRSLVNCANQFDYHEGSNRSFIEAMHSCTSLTELDLLVDGHGGQVDFHDEYYPLLSRYHSQFSFTRNLLRDAGDSHAMADQLELFLPSLFDYFNHFSCASIPRESDSSASGPTCYDFLERCTVFISHVRKLSFSDTCRLFHITDHRLLQDRTNDSPSSD